MPLPGIQMRRMGSLHRTWSQYFSRSDSKREGACFSSRRTRVARASASFRERFDGAPEIPTTDDECVTTISCVLTQVGSRASFLRKILRVPPSSSISVTCPTGTESTAANAAGFTEGSYHGQVPRSPPSTAERPSEYSSTSFANELG